MNNYLPIILARRPGRVRRPSGTVVMRRHRLSDAYGFTDGSGGTVRGRGVVAFAGKTGSGAFLSGVSVAGLIRAMR